MPAWLEEIALAVPPISNDEDGDGADPELPLLVEGGAPGSAGKSSVAMLKFPVPLEPPDIASR